MMVPAPTAPARRDPVFDLLSVTHDSTPDGILVVDAAGKITSYNRRFSQMWGLPRHVFRGRSDRAAVRAVLAQLVDPQGFQARIEYLYRNRRERSRDELKLKDGRTFERHSAPVIGSGREYFGRVWFFRDITERRRLEEREREGERLKLHREFLASVSHDLQTPLTAIEGFTETLLNGALDDARNRKRFLRTIISQSRRLRTLVDGLLELSHIDARPGHAEATPLDFAEFARSFVEGMRPVFARKRLTLKTRLQAGMRVAADEAHLARILGNLLDNAAKYSAAGGTVRLSAVRSGRWAVITVADSGIGIPAAELSRTFDRFHRSSTARRAKIPGHGLGLYLVKRLVELAGGRISVASREGQGTIFRFTLPLDATLRKR